MKEKKLPPWKANWIWGRRDPEIPNTYLYFRKSFQQDNSPTRAYCRVTADSEYRLFVNGSPVGRGPVMTEPRWKSFDTYDVTDLIRTGENVFAVVVYHYGNGTDGHEAITLYPSHGGFLLQLDRWTQDESPTSIVSDSTWLYTEETPWSGSISLPFVRTSIGRKYDRTTYPEYFDARREPEDWMEPGFDTAGWRESFAIGSNLSELQVMNVASSERYPWLHLEERTIPEFEYNRVSALSVTAGEVMELGINDPDVEMLAQDVLPCLHTSIVNPDSLTVSGRSGKPAVIHPMNHDVPYDEFDGVFDPFVLLDFGRLMNAYLSFEIDAPAGASLTIAYGQRLINGKVMPYFSPGTVCADHYSTKQGNQRYETFNWRHFRYVQIICRDLTGPITIENLEAITAEYPYEEKGEFRCSDEMLNWIWTACVNTTRVCTLDRFMDNPSRERREYTGDVANILYAIYAAFGNPAIVEKYFQDVRRGRLGYGLIPSGVLGHRSEFNRMLTDGGSFVIRIWDHYRHFGDKRILEMMYDSALSTVREYESHADENGLLGELPYCVWFDWADIQLEGIPLIINAVFLEAQSSVSKMATELGDGNVAEEYRLKVKERSLCLRELFWDDEIGVFADAVVDGRRSRHMSEHGNYLMILFGLAGNEQIERILDFFKKPPIEAGQVESCQVWPLSGLFEAGAGFQGVEVLKKRYGRIRKQGFDTVSETWYLNGMRRFGRWRCQYHRSAAQTGGTYGAYMLSHFILGIRPNLPGFASVLIAPMICGLSWASGRWPSPRGDIAVDWKVIVEKGEKIFLIELSLPAGVLGSLLLPVSLDRTRSVSHDGKEVPVTDISEKGIVVSGQTVVRQTFKE